MSRAFDYNIRINDDFTSNGVPVIPDGVEIRAHDMVFLLERQLEVWRSRGASKLLTVSQIEAVKLKEAAANAILKDWDETADGVNTNMIMGGATTYSRTYVKKGHSVPVEAPCDAQGGSLIETADVLSKWVPPADNVAEA